MPLKGDAAVIGQPAYTNIRQVNGGANSLTYIAHHRGFDRPCFQKMIHMDGASDAIAFREPRLLDAIRHENIVPVMDAQFDAVGHGWVTFVMPYYPAGSVRSSLEGGYRFSLHQAISIACDALAALAYVHSSFRYVHRDVKPGNILLNDDRQHGFLSDFGSTAQMTSDGSVSGESCTHIYQAPESFGAGARMGLTGDIYAAGITLFETLNGLLPYASLDQNVVISRLGRGARSVLDSLLEFEPHIPDPLRRCVRRAIKVKPEERYQTAREMIQDLRRVKCLDWRELTRGLGIEGTGEGDWPARVEPENRRRYRVEAKPTRAGYRVDAFQRVTTLGPWRRFGVDSVTLASADRRALAQVFSAVQSLAAQSAAA